MRGGREGAGASFLTVRASLFPPGGSTQLLGFLGHTLIGE